MYYMEIKGSLAINALGFCIQHSAEVRFASFLSSGFITSILVNPPEKEQVKRTSVQCILFHFFDVWVELQ